MMIIWCPCRSVPSRPITLKAPQVAPREPFLSSVLPGRCSFGKAQHGRLRGCFLEAGADQRLHCPAKTPSAQIPPAPIPGNTMWAQAAVTSSNPSAPEVGNRELALLSVSGDLSAAIEMPVETLGDSTMLSRGAGRIAK